MNYGSYLIGDTVNVDGVITKIDKKYDAGVFDFWFVVENNIGETFCCCVKNFRTKISVGFHIKCELVCTNIKQNGRFTNYYFGVNSYELCNVVGRADIVKFLSSSIFVGVGKKTAESLYDLYGDDTYDMLCNHFDVVQHDIHLTSKQIESLSSISDNQAVNIIQKEFPRLGLSRIQDIVVHSNGMSPHGIILRIKRNPYSIDSYCDVNIPIKVRDEIYLEDMHGDLDDDKRVNYLFAYFLMEYCRDSKDTYASTCTTEDMSGIAGIWLKSKVPFITSVPVGVYENGYYRALTAQQKIDTMASYLYDTIVALHSRLGSDLQFKIVTDNVTQERRIYDRKTYRYVSDLQSSLSSMLAGCYTKQQKQDKVNVFRAWYKNAVKNGLKSLTDEQLKAVETSVSSKYSIITGGPGRGKTYTASALLEFVRATCGDMIMLAPTGRAVKKLKNDTGFQDVETIARFLLMNQDMVSHPDFVYDTNHNEIKLKDNTYVVIDEVSMLNLADGSRLFQILRKCHIILMGDINQLSPIDAGNVLHEILKVSTIFKNEFPISFLTKNMRTLYADISDVADKLQNGSLTIRDLYSQHVTFHLLQENLLPAVIDELAADVAVDKYKSSLGKYGCEDIMLVSPRKKGAAGVNTLNRRVRDFCNPLSATTIDNVVWHHDNESGNDYFEDKGMECPGCIAYYEKNGNKNVPVMYRINDRVIRIRDNDAEKEWVVYKNNNISSDVLEVGNGFYNGESGTIVRFERGPKETFIHILLDDGKYVRLSVTKNELSVLSLGYAITAHKAQGSEAPVVINVIPEEVVNMDRHKIFKRAFYTKNSEYTICTRAKEELYIIGTKSGFMDVIHLEQYISRCKVGDNVILREYKRLMRETNNNKALRANFVNEFTAMRVMYGNAYVDMIDDYLDKNEYK